MGVGLTFLGGRVNAVEVIFTLNCKYAPIYKNKPVKFEFWFKGTIDEITDLWGKMSQKRGFVGCEIFYRADLTPAARDGIMMA